MEELREETQQISVNLQFKNKKQYAEAILKHRVLYSKELGLYACFDDQMGFVLINKKGKLWRQHTFWNGFIHTWTIIDINDLKNLPELLSNLKIDD